MIAELLTRLRFFLSREPREALDEELQFHLEQATQANIAAGMTPEEARRQALIAFGGVERAREQTHAQHPRWLLGTLAQDIRYALRQLRKAPGFAITAILTLALGIGATTAIFTLLQQVLLKSLPVAKPSELYRIGDIENCCVASGLQDDWSLFSDDLYRYFRDHTPGFDQLAAFDANTSLVAVRRSGDTRAAQPLVNEFVSGNYFSMFGVNAYEGRTLSAEDDRKSAAPVAVMSFRTWQQRYGQDPSVVGSSFDVNGQPFTVIGIGPPGFFGDRLEKNPPSFWIPLADEPLILGANSILDRPDLHWLDLIGRIQPGVNPKALESQMQVELQQWLLSPASRLKPSEKTLVSKQILRFSPGGGGVQVMQEKYQNGLHLLMWISAFVLAIACANLANLMLVRASKRRHYTSMRAALGASRMQLMRQAITESLVLAVLGGGAGLAVAFAGTRLILHLAFRNAYVPIHTTPGLPVLAFAFVVVLLTGLLFGIAPAWVTLQSEPVEALRGANRSTRSGASLTQRSLVVGQAAVSLILLCAAGMLTESLANMRHQHFGFDTTNRYILHIDPLMAGYKPAQMNAYYRQLHDSLKAIPGVASVSFSLYSPMDGGNPNETVYIEGQAPPPPDSNQNNASWDIVSTGYFKTIGTKITRGRPFTENDTSTALRVAVVNYAFAKRFFKNQSPLGKHFGSGSLKAADNFEIVGVTENAQYQGPTEPIPPMYFLPVSQSPEDGSRYLNAIEIRSASKMPDLESQVRQIMTQIDPNLTILDFQTLSDQVNATLRRQTMIARLTSLFDLLALTLAMIGLYGVTAYLVEQHTNEIGIRMALGAGRGNVLAMVLRGAFLQIAIGLLIGIPIALLGGWAMASQLFGVKPYDPLILAAATLLLGFAALIASLVPARRAASIDPMQALRAE